MQDDRHMAMMAPGRKGKKMWFSSKHIKMYNVRLFYLLMDFSHVFHKTNHLRKTNVFDWTCNIFDSWYQDPMLLWTGHQRTTIFCTKWGSEMNRAHATTLRRLAWPWNSQTRRPKTHKRTCTQCQAQSSWKPQHLLKQTRPSLAILRQQVENIPGVRKKTEQTERMEAKDGELKEDHWGGRQDMEEPEWARALPKVNTAQCFSAN